MYGLPQIVAFKTAGLSEEAARVLSKVENKSELIKYLLERYAREKMKGGGDDGQAARER
ncbi:MAG: hypothetical protein M1571_02445 [Firmicutes bacterium]|nr:hypothetical protein [Bacillota bacterium]